MSRNIIAILRGVQPHEAVDVAKALVSEGVTKIEVPLNSPEPYESIKGIVTHFGEQALIGAGTVLSTDQVAKVAEAGGRLIVSPDTNPDVIKAAKNAGLISYPGAMTPSECFVALRSGADGLKLFPGEIIGPKGVKAMKAVLPLGTDIVAVGGVGADNIEDWKQAARPGSALAAAFTSLVTRLITLQRKQQKSLQAMIG